MFPDDGSVPPHWDGFAGHIIDIDRALLNEMLIAEMSITARLRQLEGKFMKEHPEKKMPVQLKQMFELGERETLAYRRISELLRMRNER